MRWALQALRRAFASVSCAQRVNCNRLGRLGEARSDFGSVRPDQGKAVWARLGQIRRRPSTLGLAKQRRVFP
eukprot:11213621-Lingulodinium_polyedra.AAC.1